MYLSLIKIETVAEWSTPWPLESENFT